MLSNMTSDSIMTKKVRPRASPEFKVECAQLVIDQGYSVRDAAQAMDVGKSTLDKWVQKLKSERAGQFGVGPQTQTAAILLSVAGDNPNRLKNEAALASLCGANPLPASSGKTTRHRLNRGGGRAANNALWTIAMVRMRIDPRTRVYVERRTNEGLSTKEIHRCLKRYIARELFPLILGDLGAVKAVP